MTTSGPAAASSLTSSVLAAASVITRSTSSTAANEQKEFLPILPEITGTARRRAESSMGPLCRRFLRIGRRQAGVRVMQQWISHRRRASLPSRKRFTEVLQTFVMADEMHL
jgi:hypothetical protein